MKFLAILALLFPVSALAADADDDGVPDEADNCIQQKNPQQEDWDFDNVGNRCDADFDQSQVVNMFDFNLFSICLKQQDAGRSYSAACDLNADGVLGDRDLTIFTNRLGRPPGPSGLHP